MDLHIKTSFAPMIVTKVKGGFNLYIRTESIGAADKVNLSKPSKQEQTLRLNDYTMMKTYPVLLFNSLFN